MKTYFIIGLANVLSSGEIGTIDELKKINPKAFETNKPDWVEI